MPGEDVATEKTINADVEAFEVKIFHFAEIDEGDDGWGEV